MKDQFDAKKFTSGTRVLISFGAISGGFEFALQLRAEIMNKYKKKLSENLDFVYIDAVSLRDDKDTKYTWDAKLGIHKMSNPNWESAFKGAMNKCDIMIFLISKPWLQSKWCMQEFNWYNRVISEHSITPVFVVFPDAQSILNGSSYITDNEGNRCDLKGIWQAMIAHKKSVVIDINSTPEEGLKTVNVEGKDYTYNYKYVCNDEERNHILKSVIVKTP